MEVTRKIGYTESETFKIVYPISGHNIQCTVYKNNVSHNFYYNNPNF